MDRINSWEGCGRERFTIGRDASREFFGPILEEMTTPRVCLIEMSSASVPNTCQPGKVASRGMGFWLKVSLKK